LTTDLS